MVISIVMHAIVLVLYMVLLGEIFSINEDNLHAYINNSCSDEKVLIYSFDQILSET